MRTVGLFCLALVTVVASSAYLGAARRSAAPAEARAPVAAADPRLDEAARRIAALPERVAPLTLRVDGIERRLAGRAASPPPSPPVEPEPVKQEELTERALALGDWLEHYPRLLQAHIDAWRAVAEGASDPERRARAWAKLAELHGWMGDYDGIRDAHRNVVETVGLRTELGWTSGKALAMWEWGRGDIATAARIFRQVGRTPGVPRELALSCRVRAAQLSIAGLPREEVLRIHREFLEDYQGNPDPTAIARVGLITRQLQRYEEQNR